MKKPQRLAEIPAVDIQIIAQWKLNHITTCFQSQIFIFWADVNKPNIIVAVWRGEPPCPAAGFNCQKNPDILCLLDFFERIQYFLLHSNRLLSGFKPIGQLLPGG